MTEARRSVWSRTRVVQVLIAEGEAVEPLQDEGLDLVNHQFGPPVVREAGGEAPGQVQARVRAAQQGDAAVGGDHAPGEIGSDETLGEPIGSWVTQGGFDTPRDAAGTACDWYKTRYTNHLQRTNPLSGA